MRTAAENGSAEARFQLAVMHCLGKGAVKDLESAVRWFERAAEQGHALSQFNLAVMLLKGQGCERDRESAATWLHKAAASGLDQARAALKAFPSETA